LQGAVPSSARLFVREPGELSPSHVVQALRQEGLPRILTEGGPSLFAELVRSDALDQLFLTTSPALFGRFPNDERKSLADGFDLSGARFTLESVRRHGSHLFLRYGRASAG
jgi:riboflavin biosynthesis pyrimidine reductase